MTFFMAQTWSSHGPSNWFFLIHSQCAPGCSMPNFTILSVSNSPLFLEMAKIWSFYGQNMVLTGSFKLLFVNHNQCAKGILHAKFQNSRCIPPSPFPRNGQKMALLWPKQGPQMLLYIDFPKL